ncbi:MULTISPECIES: DoxX family protein [Flavobacterium]|uniref:DoxX family protein n=2 Tax=Flavobacterium TaxID=237 RepID=A0A2N9PBY7_9FLAO|nr:MULTISPECIES: DoxX family protein [Flavobacterium]QYS89104.1 DoxX family protein [Flavobacterium davisii]RVU90294.1 DoxX family protein [Flavobacterium columnare]SPE77841.1 hypothetical protein FLACOL_01851 [Flavobacterium columnare]
MDSSKIHFILKLVLTIILIQTLFYKLTASPQSIYIFKKLHIEPFGRIFSGIIELICPFLLFIDRTKFYASLLILINMTIALLSHLCILGIVIINDGGVLYILACICFTISAYFSLLYKNDLIKDYNQFKKTFL